MGLAFAITAGNLKAVDSETSQRLETKYPKTIKETELTIWF